MTDEIVRARFWPRRISWLTIVLVLLALGSFVAIARPSSYYPMPMGYGEGGGSRGVVEDSVSYSPPSMPSKPMYDMGATNGASMAPQGMPGREAYYPYPYPGQDVPITDTREFLKVNYNAEMRTRDVGGLVRRVETTVRGYDGRIDQESSSPKYGYVNFAVPMSKYDAFRTELEGLVDSRFLTLNISSQNLLPQKQSIEEQQKQADSTLADYKAARQKIVSAHTSAAQSLQSQINADEQQLTSLRAQPQTVEVQAQIQALTNEVITLRARLSNENASYSAQLKNADANIKYAEDWQKAVKTQDQALLDNVATVTGSVSIQWISLWEMAQLYLPGYWIPTIFAVLAFLSLLYDRRRFG